MSLFFCNSCTEAIPAQKARLRCQECPGPEYDICTNCYVLGTVTGAHVSTHQTTVSRISGFVDMPAPPPPPPLPPRQTSSPFDVSRAGSGPAPAGDGTAPSLGAASWDVLFDPKDWQPTESGQSICTAIFTALDPQRLGYITPEANSELLAVIGTLPANNIWRHIKDSIPGPDGERQADDTLKALYDMFSVEYVLKTRPTAAAPTPQAPPTSFRGALLHALTTAGAGAAAAAPGPSHPFPGLTANGFAELMRMDALLDPDKAWRDWNVVLGHYSAAVGRARGALPRAVFPAAPVPAMVAWLQQKKDQAEAEARARAAAEARAAEMREAQQAAAESARLANQARSQALSDMRVRQAEIQMQRSAESIERMGCIGTGYKVVYEDRWP